MQSSYVHIYCRRLSVAHFWVFPAILTVWFWIGSENVAAEPFFEDGYLGLTQREVHETLGTPHSIRSRKAALRVFSYYSAQDWEKYFKKLVSPENGEDVYTYKRNDVQVRYSFVYSPDRRERRDFPTLYVKRVEVEFSPAVSIETIPQLVHEFSPPTEPGAPAFRSNLWVLIFKGNPTRKAELIVQERDKENWEWSLAFQMFSLQGIPDYLTLQVPIDRLEFTTQSLRLVKQSQRLTHVPMLNPFSKEFANRPPKPPQRIKPVPVPQYAD